MVSYHDDRLARDRLRDTVRSANDTLYLASNRYKNGLADFLNVLNAQMTLTTARQNLARAEVSQIDDVVTLYRALGGGWMPLDEPKIDDGLPITPAALDSIAAKP